MKEDMESSGSDELSAVIGALLDSLEDRSPAAQSSILSALRSISHHSPSTLIHAAVYFLELHRKLPQVHTSSVLRTMSETLRDSSSPLAEDLATSVAELSVSHLTQESEQESSELLVSLSRLHCTQSMGGLLSKFQPSLIPPPPVVRAMGLIASCNPFGMVPFIKLTLSIVLPLLPQVHEDTQKLAFCFLLGKFAEAINDYIMNLDEAPDPAISKDSFTEEMSKSFDILTNNWMKTSRNVKLLEASVSALCPILSLLPEQNCGQRAVKLIPMLLQLCKYPNCRLAGARAIAILLNNTLEENREALRPFLEQLQTILFDLVNVTPFEAFRDALLTHYEVLQCFRSLVVLYPEEGLDRILQHLKNPSGTYRARSLVVLRHLINTLPSDDDASLQRIALSLQNSLSDGNAKQMVGAIVALAAHQTLPLLPSQRATFIRYLVIRCGASSEEPQAYEEALFLLATTVDGAETWLWPALLRSLLDSTFSASAVPILRSLSALAVKIIRADSGNPFKEFSGTKILAKCLELCGDEKNRLAVVIFLRSSAPLLGHQLKPEWDGRLLDISRLLEDEEGPQNHQTKLIIWEEQMVEFLEKSVDLEGKEWASKLSKELILECSPKVAAYLAAVTEEPEHLTLLIHSARSQPFVDEYPRSIGIASKRHLSVILSLMEAACEVEDSRKHPTRLLGLVRDSKAAASAEASKAALLRCYAEISKRSDSLILFPHIERHILPWIIKHLNDSRETTTKEAGLIALEQVGGAVHPNRLANSSGLKARASCLASLLNLLQSHSGYRPLQIYPNLLDAMISLLRIPPALNPEERFVLLSTILDKVIGASCEVDLILQVEGMQRVVDGLGVICGEVIGDSADALAELVDVLIPWMQSKSAIERRMTLLVLRYSLRSYHDSLKYTYPGGKLEPGRLLGRILSWSADGEKVLRPLVVDCVALALGINARHRSTLPDNNLNQDLTDSKKILTSGDDNTLYEGVRTLATAACERISSGEVPSLAEGLIEGLLFRGESVAAGVSLIQLFKTRGADIPRSDLYLVDNIITQMRQMENSSCRQTSAEAIKILTIHHPEEVFEHLLHQPLPLDRGTEECWKKLGVDDFGIRTLDFLLNRLENNQLLAESAVSKDGRHSSMNFTASFPSLAAVVALRHLLQCPNAEELIEKRLAVILSVLLKYLAGWLHVDAPVSVISTKFGFVPNREACKLDPHGEVYSVLTNVLTVVNIHVASSLLNEVSTASESQADENLVSTVRSVIRCLGNKNELLANIAQTLGKMITSPISAQRAVAAAFYAELIGRVDCGEVWLDAIINTLHEAKADSSGLVRKLATIGLTRIAYLEQRQVDEYFDNCTGALLEGLEEPSSGEGGHDVVLESLRGLSLLLGMRTEKPVSPRVVLALKPFVEKENWEIRLAAISALGALVRGWIKSIRDPDDDVSDHLLGCLPCLTIKIEDNNSLVAKAARETLFEAANLLQSEGLAQVLRGHLAPGVQVNVEGFLKDLVACLMGELPQRAEELRNAVVRGYSRSEVHFTRATAVLILGLFGKPRAEDVQRMLQLLRDKEGEVRARAAEALALGFTS
ncbi:maestro heat-like repeat-containing protein family member 1 [Fopius arisanus]|uniref:HEATR7A_0 protein n=1 Tax=Fopius arisanus TaxID=64838 RepID=A0A0C9QF73_9HYME|nr:PREDICTED: maestro heat-like repeat-containing protein family member 1 [Fopius arisanus]